MQKYKIETVSYGVLGNADFITINVRPFFIGEETASIVVTLENSEKSFETKILTLPTDVYEAWGTDDSVIINWVCEELGLTLI